MKNRLYFFKVYAPFFYSLVLTFENAFYLVVVIDFFFLYPCVIFIFHVKIVHIGHDNAPLRCPFIVNINFCSFFCRSYSKLYFRDVFFCEEKKLPTIREELFQLLYVLARIHFFSCSENARKIVYWLETLSRV